MDELARRSGSTPLLSHQTAARDTDRRGKPWQSQPAGGRRFHEPSRSMQDARSLTRHPARTSYKSAVQCREDTNSNLRWRVMNPTTCPTRCSSGTAPESSPDRDGAGSRVWHVSYRPRPRARGRVDTGGPRTPDEGAGGPAGRPAGLTPWGLAGAAAAGTTTACERGREDPCWRPPVPTRHDARKGRRATNGCLKEIGPA